MISVNTMREFLDLVASLYEKAKKPSSRLFDKRIVRGRAKCIASQAEEAFADFICKSILRKKPHYKVFVDFPITVNFKCGDKHKTTRYVDFMLCREENDKHYRILYMAELKMNMGWMRDQVVSCADDMNSLCKALFSGDISARNGGEGSSRMKFSISKETKYDLIILSGVNTDLETLRDGVNKINNRNDGYTHAVILTNEPIRKGCHINKGDKKLLDDRIRGAISKG